LNTVAVFSRHISIARKSEWELLIEVSLCLQP
jgi:hypothetical protein